MEYLSENQEKEINARGEKTIDNRCIGPSLGLSSRKCRYNFRGRSIEETEDRLERRGGGNVPRLERDWTPSPE